MMYEFVVATAFTILGFMLGWWFGSGESYEEFFFDEVEDKKKRR